MTETRSPPSKRWPDIRVMDRVGYMVLGAMGIYIGMEARDWTFPGIMFGFIGVSAAISGTLALAFRGMKSPVVGRRRLSYATACTVGLAMAFVVLSFLVSGFAFLYFKSASSYPTALLTKDYGASWPRGELTRLSNNECKGTWQVPEQKSNGYFLRCGTWIWTTKTYRFDTGTN